jgi:purine-cytosine permease-like protein
VGPFLMGIVVGLMAAVAIYLIASMFRSIQDEKKSAGITHTWKNFGLSIAFCILFLLTWAGQGVAQWQEYTDEARTHNESVEVGDFMAVFSKSTLENWQSEFLQLFSFVVLSALLIHHGSAESKDSDNRMEEALRRIEKQLGTK